jgi:hypothetical protein
MASCQVFIQFSFFFFPEKSLHGNGKRGERAFPLSQEYTGLNFRLAEFFVGILHPHVNRRKAALRIRMFLGLLDPDPSLFCTDPDRDPCINKQKK